MKKALEIEKLYARRGAFWLKDVNLVIEEEKIHAVTGKSGSGKSTLIRAVGGAVRPEAGCIRYFGQEMYENEREIRTRMSVVYDTPNFNIELKPDGLVKELCKFEPWFDQSRYVQMMSEMELNRQIKVKLYSEGQQRKLMLILALCRNPELLVMDEATSGMDRASRAAMWKLIVDYRQKNPLSVLFTTHHEEELYVADRIWQVEDGRIEPSVL
ncbi:MAG: ABC transporter ATP-binding protein [Lachnobacterium sp.]|nr:ABC transporter ATP-binding protein [Lachnobacterium sp.]